MFALLLFLLLAPPQVQGARRIQLCRRAVVSGPVVLLVDVVTRSLSPRQGVIELSPSPRPGMWLRLSRATVLKTVSSVDPELARRLMVPSHIRVKRLSRRVHKKALYAMARKAVEQVLPKGAKVRRLSLGIAKCTVPRTPLRMEVIASSTRIQKGRIYGRMALFGGNERVRQFSFAVNFTLLLQVPVARTLLRRGTLIDHSHLTYTPLDVTRLNAVHTSAASVLGTIVQRPIPRGSTIATSAVRLPRLVKRGQRVVLLAKIGTIVASAWGIARMDGVKGQRIRVQNSKSRKFVTGVVVAPGRVEVVKR